MGPEISSIRYAPTHICVKYKLTILICAYTYTADNLVGQPVYDRAPRGQQQGAARAGEWVIIMTSLLYTLIHHMYSMCR